MLKIYTARADTSMLELVLEGVGRDLKRIRENNPPAKRVLLVVPAQFTLEAEEEAFRYFDAEVFFDFHVMSGNRLQSEIIKECGGLGTTSVNNLGRTMLLRKIAAEKKADLKAFSKVVGEGEFLKMTGDFILQLKQNNPEGPDFASLKTLANEGSLLASKLSDMQQFYEAYEAVMKGKFSDAEDELKFVTSKVCESKFVAESIFWYYGFYSFTPRQADFISQIARYSPDLNLAIMMGLKKDPDAWVFEAPADSVRMLKQRAEAAGAEVDIFTSEGAFARNMSADLAHLERNLFAAPAEIYKDKPESIELVRCSSALTQAQSIAAKILSLVRDEAYRYDEIAILTEDMEGMGSAIERVCGDFGAPLFVDEKRAVSHAPGVETAAALLEAASGGRRAPDMLRCLKPGIIELESIESPADLEFLENYCKHYKIFGTMYLKPFKYGKAEYGEEGMAKLESMRSEFADLIKPFIENMKNAKTVKDKSIVFYRFMAEELKMPDKLEATAAGLADLLMLDAAEEQRQLWEALISLLEQCVELLGDEEPDNFDYAELLTQNLADIKLGLLPQAEGKVQLGSLGRSLTSNIRALFIAGVNDGLIPKDEDSGGILTARELNELEKIGFKLAKTDEVLRRENRLSVYKAFTAPCDYLWLGYCIADEKGNEMKPSLLVEQIKDMFPQLSEEQDIDSGGAALPFVQGSAAAAGRLGAQMRAAAADGRLPDPIWQEVYNQLEDNGAVKAGLLFKNQEPPLSEEDVKFLYARSGGDFVLSPSRLENFAQCPFKHFVNYGLRPKEHRDFVISPLERGNIHHECLLMLSEWLSEPSQKGRFAITDARSRWMSVTEEELEDKLNEIIEEIQKRESAEVLSSSSEQSYRLIRIKEICLKFALRMVSHVRSGSISKMAFEAQFGKGQAFPPLRISTPAGEVYIEGKIDRVDLLASNDGPKLKVIDYKSGLRKFDRKSAEAGLELQLGIYLEAALAGGDVEPAGVFYYNIANPQLKSGLDQFVADEISEDLWEKIREAYRMDGLFIKDSSVLDSIDSNRVQGSKSEIINYILYKNGNEDGSGVDAEEFEEFRRNFKQVLEETCARLISGEIDIAPRKGSGACEYCDYRAICAFDRAFPENRYI